MTDVKPLFIDTNILIYANVSTAPLHQIALDAIKARCQASQPLWISRQVLREFISTRSRVQTFSEASAAEDVIERVGYLRSRFLVADDTAAVTSALVKLMSEFTIGGKQIHDANIVATMLAYDIPCLLTHNIKDFRRFADIIQVEGIV